MATVSILMDKAQFPTKEFLAEALQERFPVWQEVAAYALSADPGASEEWNHSKLGWNYHIKSKKSVIIYMMPCAGYLIVSFVFGKEASEHALSGPISEEVKDIIRSAKVHTEGRGFRSAVTSKKMIADIKKLIDIKLMATR